MNKVLTIRALKDSSYGTQKNPIIEVQTEEGLGFGMRANDLKGWAIGAKIRYAVTLLDGPQQPDTDPELEAAYATISDLVDKAKKLAQEAASGATARKALFVSVGANLLAVAWNVLT